MMTPRIIVVMDSFHVERGRSKKLVEWACGLCNCVFLIAAHNRKLKMDWVSAAGGPTNEPGENGLLLLAHAGDIGFLDTFERWRESNFPDLAVNYVWYSGDPSGPLVSNTDLVKYQGSHFKIWECQPREGVVFDNSAFGELIGWAAIKRIAASEEDATLPSLLRPPPDSGALFALSALAQCELFRQHAKLGKWIEAHESNPSAIPASVRDFQNIAKRVDAKRPDYIDWLVFLNQPVVASVKALIDEARLVSRSLGLSAGEQERLCLTIQQLVTEIQKGTGGPMIETLVRVYDALCLLEKEGKER